ncbi:hypothetical protein CHS0354_040217 [Potamilus streckersoni]|uniref:Uncharacterized protein n=1 Tax=Potamilus streckersoni TaxID=2493646 RepID=A0AAE0VV50_9BIVA|nr:hypothetical protein CHS0354_040217 [Potamilus streckersoni]
MDVFIEIIFCNNSFYIALKVYENGKNQTAAQSTSLYITTGILPPVELAGSQNTVCELRNEASKEASGPNCQLGRSSDFQRGTERRIRTRLSGSPGRRVNERWIEGESEEGESNQEKIRGI